MTYRQSAAITVIFILSAALGPAGAKGENRTYDGTGNNITHPSWGAAGTDLPRMAATPAYDDGFSTPRGGLMGPTFPNPVLPNPRVVSNMVVKQLVMLPNSHEMTDWIFQWGQFVDHDLDLTNAAVPAENFPIEMPPDDPIFHTSTMDFQRSKFDPSTGTGSGNPRQQINDITSYLDASMIYGSDAGRAAALRGANGRLLASGVDDNLLPRNTMGLANGTGGPFPADQFYVAGDVRANEQIGLTAVHTLFLREHNRLAEQIATANPSWTSDEIYQRARKLVGGEVEAITFNEFLPALLGSSAPSVTGDYDGTLSASVLNEFSTALFRVGHTMLSPNLLRIQNDGSEAPGGPVSLRDAFFKQHVLDDPGEVEYFLKGLASDQQQEIDMHLVDDVRDFLFGEPIPGGFDLATLNIQRGRDHGLPGYNAVRVAFGLSAKSSFADISSDPAIQAGLESLYGSVDDVDAWVGALSEDHYLDSQVGELITKGLAEQFRRTRDGDRLWFLRDSDLSPEDVNWLMSTRLSDVIRRNTAISNLQANVFFMVPEPSAIVLGLLAAIGGRLFARRRTK